MDDNDIECGTESVPRITDCVVVCYGEAMVSVSPKVPQSVLERSLCFLGAAGAEFNVAAHLAALGTGSLWAGAVGDDPLGTILLDEASRRGVDTALVTVDPDHPTGIYLKSTESTGPRMLYYRRGSAAAAHMPTDRAPGGARVQPTVVHTTGITPALSSITRSAVDGILDGSLFPGALTSVDINYRPALWSDAGDAADVLLDIAQSADIVFVGRDEAETVWGTSDAVSIRTLVDRPRWLIVKDGADVATEFCGQARMDCPAPTVDVVEPVGAGDAFAAGWLSAFGETTAPEDAARRLRRGHFMASQVLRVPGGICPPPDLDAVRAATETPVERWGTGILS